MNENLGPEHGDFAESLKKQFHLSTPNSVKAELLFHCGVAAAEANLKNRQRGPANWLKAVALLLAFGLGGLGGRFTNQTAVQNQVGQSSQTADVTHDIRETNGPALDWSAITAIQPSTQEPRIAFTPAMDLDQASQVLTRSAATVLSTDSIENPSPPFSVGMSNRDLDRLLSL